MYNRIWDYETGGYLLSPDLIAQLVKEVRPVYHEELDLLGFREKGGWIYEESSEPLLWAETRTYYHGGQKVAAAVGGGLYTAPELQFEVEGLRLEPINTQLMVGKNRLVMQSLVNSTLEKIYNVYREYRKKGIDVIYVAFSGGKDSLVLLDLVARALPHDDFVVVFGDTGMEIPDTYDAVNTAKTKYSDIRFYTAQSHLEAKDSWRLFGPPSRTQRWCCSVHKSAPSLLLLRELTGSKSMRALAFDGVRAEESNARATYDMVSDGRKHRIQTNCSPMLNWYSSEVFMYLFEHDLLLNRAYRTGSIRVGCALCPTSSPWWDFIANARYHTSLSPFVELLDQYAEHKELAPAQRNTYLDTGGWKGRVGGRGLRIGGNRVIEQASDGSFTAIVRQQDSDWREWIKAIGNLSVIDGTAVWLDYDGSKYRLSHSSVDDKVCVTLSGLANSKTDIRLRYLFRNAINKAAFCVGCRVCAVACASGAISTRGGAVILDEEKCVHCHACLDKPKGCLVAKSLATTMGGDPMNPNNLKGMNRYQHFGFRKEWLQYLGELGEDFWASDKLGNRQFDAFRVWLKEAGILENNRISSLGSKLLSLGSDSLLTWGVIAANLAYNSTIFRWYVRNVDFGVMYAVSDLVTMLGDDHSESTRKNAITSLVETFKRSPIGTEVGCGVCEFRGKQVVSVQRNRMRQIDERLLLYTLYVFAEKMDGYHSFTLAELMNDSEGRSGIGPGWLFGLDRESLEKCLLGLSLSHPNAIRVDFSKDLDNIFLDKGRQPEEMI